MISMDFLSKQRVTGTEFIDFQSDEFYSRLTKCLDAHITIDGSYAVLSAECQIEVLELIKNYTGFENITMKFLEAGNLWVDTGYFAPGHVLNNPGVEMLMKASQTTLYRWFVENKGKMFKGGIDYSTGKVFGSFATVPVDMGINVHLTSFFPLDKVTKWKVTIGGALAGAICHELGHVFSGCVMMLTQLEDNVTSRAGLEAYRGAKRPEDRVVVLKDTATLLGVQGAKLDELKAYATNDNEEMYLLYYTKMAALRNNQRALSVGVAEMTSEVVADMYAIRMGCDKGIVAAIGTLVDRGLISVTIDSLMFGCMFSFYTAVFTYVLTMGMFMAAPPVLLAMFFMGALAAYFTRGYSGGYNADHRRLEDAMRQLIAKLKADKKMPSNERTELLERIGQAIEMMRAIAPWYDNTVIYRFMGWVFSGSDFKLKEIENYTQALNNHELTALSAQLKTL